MRLYDRKNRRTYYRKKDVYYLYISLMKDSLKPLDSPLEGKIDRLTIYIQ